MATTSQVTSYRSAGQPDDGVGAVGDTCFDTTNRMFWVKQSGNTWVGGGYSAVGPVGPAQLSYNGTPPASFGQNGNGCVDLTGGLTYLKSNNAWSQIGSIVGPSGQSQPSLGNFANTFGPNAQANALSVAAATSASQYTAMNIPGQAQTFVYTPAANCYLTSVQITNYGGTGATAYFFLGDANKNIVYNYNGGNGQAQGTIGTSTIASPGTLLSAGTAYYWYVGTTAARNVTANVVMTVTTPSTGTGIGFAPAATLVNNASLSLSSTASSLALAGINSQTYYFKYAYASYLYGAQFQLAGSGNVQLSFGGVYTSPSYTLSSGGSIVNVGPFGVSSTYLAANSQNTWNVTGSGTLSSAVVLTQIAL